MLDMMKFDPLEIKFKPNFMLYPSIAVLLKFYLFLNGAKDRFESSLLDPPLSLSDAQAIKDEILRLLRVIDELNLSLDVYK